MKNEKFPVLGIFYLSAIIFSALLFMQTEFVFCYANEAHNKQSESVARYPNRLWCKEHGVYEDDCFICHPELTSN